MIRQFLKFLLLFSFLGCGRAASQSIDRTFFSVDSNDKIVYTEKYTVDSTSKQILFDRALKFLAFENWDRLVSIKCENNATLRTKVVDAIVFKDENMGIIQGNGFFQMPYYKDHWFTLNFAYKIEVKDNRYRFIIDNFVYIKYVTAGTAKAEGFNVWVGSQKTSFSDAVIKEFPLEKLGATKGFIRNREEFCKNIQELTSKLKSFMSNNPIEDW